MNCKCENHLDKLESEVELPISAKRLYHILFDEGNSQYLDIWERKTAENKSKGKKKEIDWMYKKGQYQLLLIRFIHDQMGTGH